VDYLRSGEITDSSVKTIHEEMMVCIAHDRENFRECMSLMRTPKKCHAMLASELTLESGCKLPVVADACHVHNERMPVCLGLMGNQSVSVLSDAGCSTVVVKRKLVDDKQMTGGTETCILIDGAVRRTPVAEIEIEMPYYTGKVKVVCMDNPLHDAIIGNVPGVSE